MAAEKKSFILYCDQIHIFEELTDEEAGKLIKHIYRYTNDQDPELADRMLKILFQPIKHQLKRDLISWEQEREIRAKNGHIGGIKSGESRKKRSTPSKTKHPFENEAVPSKRSKPKEYEVNEAVTVTVNVNENVKGESSAPPLFVNAEAEMLARMPTLEALCIKTHKSLDTAKKVLRKYHLHCEEHNRYPMTIRSIEAGLEKWLTTEFDRKPEQKPIQPQGPKLKVLQ